MVAPAELLVRPKLCEGRGTERPELEKLRDATAPCPLPPVREDPNALDLAGAGRPAFDPNLLCMVGLTFGLPRAGALRTALALTRTAFWRTGNPRSSVPRETAVKPPRAFKLA